LLESENLKMVKKIHRLRCSCNSYDWGKKGSASLAARLAAKSGFAVDESKPYAEMWMGTYPTLPTQLLETGQDLQDLLKSHPDDLIGPDVLARYPEPTLPFLPKILSVAKALPLQVHPDKLMAERLNASDPSSFGDDNHKPEIAVAITEFEAFCGFRPLKDVAETMRLEPLKRFLPPFLENMTGGEEFDDGVLKFVVSAVLSAGEDVIEETQVGLGKLAKKDFGHAEYIVDLLPRLQEQYGKRDPGIVCALATMNYMRIQPGEALYVPADGLHAWLAGDIVECMARSDNVLNVGFCPASDRASVDTFSECLTFSPHSPEKCLLPGTKWKSGRTVEYTPPLGEFRMLALDMDQGDGERKEEWFAGAGPGILFVTEGKGEMGAEGETFQLEEGNVFFVGHHTGLSLTAKGGLKAYMAFTH
jgi:mannose-6-phosphate isomerase